MSKFQVGSPPPPESNKGNILILVNTYAPDDPRVIYGATSLAKMGYRVKLIGVARQREGELQTRQQIDRVEAQLLPMVQRFRLQNLWWLMRGHIPDKLVSSSRYRTNFLSFVFFNLWLIRIAWRGQTDIIHCHDLSPLPAGWLLARIKRAKLIYDVHENVPTMYSGRKGRLLARLERWLVKKPDVVISAGVRLQGELQKRGAKQCIHIGNWKRLGDYEIAPEQLQEKRRELEIPDDAPVITYIGTLDPTREIQPLLQAVIASPDVHLIVGGRGLLMDDVIQSAATYYNIHWLGWVHAAEVPLYTLLADALYCCLDTKTFEQENYYAPAANKLFEAYAAGIPLIARRGVNEIGDILAKDDTGILIDDVTSESLQQVFTRLQDKTYVQVIQKNIWQVRHLYHWGIAEQRLSEIYSMLMS